VDDSVTLIDASEQFAGSTSSGNLVATAIQKSNDLDIVLYPSEFLRTSGLAIVGPQMDSFQVAQALDAYPEGKSDVFQIGRMTGRDIKQFITERVQKTGRADFQVAGIRYHVHLVGGIVQYAYFNLEDNTPIVDRDYYKVAISDFLYDYKQSFPGYYYGNGLSHSFNSVDRFVSAKESLRNFLTTAQTIPLLKMPRARVSEAIIGDSGTLPIYKIQGMNHLSPYLGFRATTRGIVTALGKPDRSGGGFDVYIQDQTGDGIDETSDALYLSFVDNGLGLKLGDEIVVAGIVNEEMTSLGMSRTSLKKIDSATIVSRGNMLPTPVWLGSNGRKIPSHHVSTWRGDLNRKPLLNLQDGIDFWESLEGMRVQVRDIAVQGFLGGLEEFAAQRPKGHLSLNVLMDSLEEHKNRTKAGGIMIDSSIGDFNPELVQLQVNHLTKGISTSTVFNVGDVIAGDLTAVLTFEPNIFGEGEWALVLPEQQRAILDFQSQGIIALEDRPATSLITENERQLTVGTFNLENLSGNQDDRIREMAKAMKVNMGCPDIINLVEIQDNNGVDFGSGSGAEITLRKLIQAIDCSGKFYRAINIDPFNHGEGGEPGGNIRVAMLYDSGRVNFKAVQGGNAFSDTMVDDAGNLTHNPGRVFPNSPEFKGTRKSPVAQFEFLGQKVFVIGNHFNSKLGDSSSWSNIQPVQFGSETKRAGLARMVNKFVQMIERQEPSAHVIVLGDFNAYAAEAPMKVLEGNQLINLMTYGNLVPKNQRYTTNFNGSSQSLDYIFVNKNLLKRSPEHEVLHINSDFMGRLSDHDPLVARFTF
jgi:hypothetical protein